MVKRNVILAWQFKDGHYMGGGQSAIPTLWP
jgi:hypothetical protein